MTTQLNYRLAVESDTENIVEFLSCYFFKDEPCLRALQLPLEETKIFFRSTISRCLKTPFSTIVTTNDNEIAAVLLNSVWRRSDKQEEVDFDNDESSEKAKCFFKILNEAHSIFWSLAPSDIDAVVHREISSVATHFQRKGIATRMLTENMKKDKLEEYKIGGIVSETSSFANQTLLAKHGFNSLTELPYSNCVDSNGHRILRTDDGSTGLRLNFNKIVDFCV